MTMPEPADRPTVFIVDDDAAVRDSLSSLLSSAGIASAGFATAEAFLGAFEGTRPGCLVTDVRMSGQSGLALQKTLAERGDDLPIIFITGYADVATAVGAMKAGALDFLEKPFNQDQLLSRIREALARDAESRRRKGSAADAAARLARLTRREKDILRRVLDGKSSREIAQEIFRTEKTVEFHRRNILRKLGVRKTIQVRDLINAAGLPLDAES
ncbi:MAG: response regulator transcription factor [Phycisphaeraceae bacterium]|nr:response regulator transcription factor [Phycisphaeraceae bacterium]